jgi:hypothetical protein
LSFDIALRRCRVRRLAFAPIVADAGRRGAGLAWAVSELPVCWSLTDTVSAVREARAKRGPALKVAAATHAHHAHAVPAKAATETASPKPAPPPAAASLEAADAAPPKVIVLVAKATLAKGPSLEARVVKCAIVTVAHALLLICTTEIILPCLLAAPVAIRVTPKAACHVQAYAHALSETSAHVHVLKRHGVHAHSCHAWGGES